MTQLGAKTALHNTYYKLSELLIFQSNYFGFKQKEIGFKTLIRVVFNKLHNSCR